MDLLLKLVAVEAVSCLPPFYKCLGIYDMGLYVCCHVFLSFFFFPVSTTVTPALGALAFSLGGKPAWTYTRKEAFVSGV